jgi:hypothetical protein
MENENYETKEKNEEENFKISEEPNGIKKKMLKNRVKKLSKKQTNTKSEHANPKFDDFLEYPITRSHKTILGKKQLFERVEESEKYIGEKLYINKKNKKQKST